MTTSTLATLTIGGEPQAGRRGQLSRAQPGQAGRDRRRGPRADRAQIDGAVIAARNRGRRMAGFGRRRAGRQGRRGGGDGRDAAQRESDGGRRYTSEHGKVLAEAGFEDRHRADGRGGARVDGGGGARPRADRPAGTLSTVASRAVRRCGPCYSVQPAAGGDDDEADVGADRGQTAVVKLPPTVPLAALSSGRRSPQRCRRVW